MEIRLTSLAEIELNETISYYERQKTELGKEFYLEVEKTVSRIERFPKSCLKVGPHTHRCLVSRFPFAVYYAIDFAGDIIILAIAHTHRNPEHLLSRIE